LAVDGGYHGPKALVPGWWMRNGGRGLASERTQQGQGGTPMTKVNRVAGVKTDPEVLKFLPQFQPDTGFDVDHVDSATGEYRAFPAARHNQLVQILQGCMQPYLRNFKQEEQQSRLDRFLSTAVRAIASYEHQRKEQANFDRAAARKLVLAAHKTSLDAANLLQQIAMNRHLASFLKRLFVSIGRQPNETSAAKSVRSRRGTAALRSATKKLSMRMKSADATLQAYHNLAPAAVAGQLSRLAPLLMLAAERLTFQAGDKQRDDIARNFTDEMTHTWLSATGTIPTYAKPSPRSRKPSPFAMLLASINTRFLPADFRSKNDFRDYTVASIKQLKANPKNTI
jgi:hypothetical protein